MNVSSQQTAPHPSRNSPHLLNEKNDIWPGTDDFVELVGQFKTVDKSWLVHDFWHSDPCYVSVVLRPRRFGKSLGLSMLKHFFEVIPDVEQARKRHDLFSRMKIADCPDCMEHMGKYPVLLLCLKDLDANNLEEYRMALLSTFYDQLKQSVLPACPPEVVHKIDKTFENREGCTLPGLVEEMLNEVKTYIGQSFIILIDDYDYPQQLLYDRKFSEVAQGPSRVFFTSLLKSNPHLRKALCVGVLPVSYCGLLAGVNIAQLRTMIKSRNDVYDESFGFTCKEVMQLCSNSTKRPAIDVTFRSTVARIADLVESDSWPTLLEKCFNGYLIGANGTTIYNPWSVTNSIANARVNKYWALSGIDKMLHRALWFNVDCDVVFDACRGLIKSDEEKDNSRQLHVLLDPEACISHTMLDRDIGPAIFWALMVHAGYLAVEPGTGQTQEATLFIPNYEVYTIWMEWFAQPFTEGLPGTDKLIDYIHRGDREHFEKLLRKYLNNLSQFDIPKAREDLYHIYALCMTVEMQDRHWNVHSNIESGRGRFDLLFFRNDNPTAILLELKDTPKDASADDIDALLNKGLMQIRNREYGHILHNHRHITKANLACICLHDRQAYFKYGTATCKDMEWKYDLEGIDSQEG